MYIFEIIIIDMTTSINMYIIIDCILIMNNISIFMSNVLSSFSSSALASSSSSSSCYRKWTTLYAEDTIYNNVDNINSKHHFYLEYDLVPRFSFFVSMSSSMYMFAFSCLLNTIIRILIVTLRKKKRIFYF